MIRTYSLNIYEVKYDQKQIKTPSFPIQLKASDLDSNSVLRYKLLHVSNGGRSRFGVDARTGDVFAVAPVAAGERFSLTVAAEDQGGKSSTAIMEVGISLVLSASIYNEKNLSYFVIAFKFLDILCVVTTVFTFFSEYTALRTNIN